MRSIRFALAGLLVVASLVAVYRLCWLRFECEVLKRETQFALSERSKGDYEKLVIARELTERLKRCLAHDPTDYQTYFMLAMAAEATGNPEQALAMYKMSLELNERPEIYANMAVLELQLGRPAEAESHLLRACYFQIAYSGLVAHPMQGELYAQVIARQERLKLLAEQRRRR